MTTSAQTINELTGNTLVTRALRKLGVSNPTTGNITEGLDTLNPMLMGLQADGMPLWKLTKYSLPLQTATSLYTIGIGQTVNIPYALKLTQVLRVSATQGTPIPLEIKSIFEYNRLPTNNTGVPVSFAYTPKTNYGELRIWPSPSYTDTQNYTLDLWYQKPFDVFVTGDETIDFPQYWQEAIIYGLATRLAPEYSIPLSDRQLLEKEATFLYDKALSFGTEEASFFIQPAARMPR